MGQFKDSTGRDWRIEINVATVKLVREILKVDLLDLDGGTLIKQLIDDPVLLVDVIYVVCQDQAIDSGVTDQQFGRAMSGDAIDRATQCLLEALTDFFPQHRRRLLKTAVRRFEELEAKGAAALETRINSPAIEARMDQEIRRLDETLKESTSGDSSGDLPDRSASIQDR